MRRVAPVVFAASLLAGLACGPTPPPKPAPEATEVGTPVGAAATGTIGAAGGQLRSPDGRLTVDVPAGALAADTALSIQPITNTAHGGVSSAYLLTPEGQTFQQPVTLTFTYTDDDLVGTAPEALSINFQTAERYWQLVETTRDVAAKTLSAKTSHFSAWAFATRLRLAPASTSVAVSKSVTLTVEFCQDVEGKPDSKGVQPFYGYKCRPISAGWGFLLKDWEVNDIPGGNDLVGRLAPQAEQAVYTAPGVRPQPATVEASTVFTFKDTTFRLHSRIKVIDVPPTLNGTYTLDYSLQAPDYTESFHVTGTFVGRDPSGAPSSLNKDSDLYTYRVASSDVSGTVSSYVKDHTLYNCTSVGGALGSTSAASISLAFDPEGSFFSGNLKGHYDTACTSKSGNPPYTGSVSLNAQFGGGNPSPIACELLFATAPVDAGVAAVPFPDSVSGHANYTCATTGGTKTVSVSWTAASPP